MGHANRNTRLKSDDEVIVITGKHKGEKGRILRVLEDGRLLVEGINVRKHHRSPRKYRDAGLVEKETPIDASNVSLIDPESGTATRVRTKIDDEGKKVRVAVKSGAVLD
ncbi:MAG: 50S ribosomal protein L24 [Myxococcota bacterium]